MTVQRVRIELAEFGQKCRVWIGDVEVSQYLRRFDVHAEVGEPTTIILETIAVPAEIRGWASVVSIIEAGRMALEAATGGVKTEPPATNPTP